MAPAGIVRHANVFRRSGIASVLAAVLAIACGSDPPASVNSFAPDSVFGKFDVPPSFDIAKVDGKSDGGDGGLTDGNIPDVPDDTSVVPGEYGSPCVQNSDCSSNFCIDGPAGKVCTKTCVETCDDGWACTQVASQGDTVFICKPRFLHLCDPCNQVSDCNDAGGIDNLCVTAGPLGSFCGAVCNPAKSDCPGNYECAATTNEDTGKAVYQCVPKSGQCACSPAATANKRSTTCSHKNVFGKCLGSRACTPDGLSDCDAPVPAEEECNGLDDNCDGQTDEGIEGAKCKKTNAFGSCIGVAKGCENGKAVCDAKEPELEICNGLDDDCDGVVDNGICDDGNPCTKDICNGADCKHDQGALGLTCDDGNACTQEDQCAAGACVGGGLKTCDDQNACTTDACDPAKGCVHGSVAAATSCDSDGNPCTADGCDGKGKCVHPALDTGSACPDDGNACTADTCDGAGACLHNANNVCNIGGTCVQPGTVNPADPCQVCNPLQSKTQWVLQNGLACDDGDACTVADKCTSGTCKGKLMDCSAKDSQCAQGQCANGLCFAAAKAGACSDGNQCTQNDTCIDGVCKGVDKDCSALNDKCSIGVCQLGQCTQAPKLGACDDGDPCTVGDSCAGGGCKGTPMDCSALDSTCSKGLCSGGQCVGKPVNSGFLCDDGNACTSGDLCQNGQCTGNAKNCTYLDTPCQSGACQGGQCFAQPKGGGCSDGDACTVNDACNGGSCKGVPMDCSGNSSACGQSTCSGGQCSQPIGGECSPGQTQSQSQACGNCGNQTRTRSCTNGCTWGAWGSYGTCGGQGVCAAGQTQSQGCGNCGSQTRTCNGSCQWGGFSGCSGSGPCSPGQTTGCGDSSAPCSVQTCGGNCQWGGCGLKPGAQCEWKSGNKYQCCGYLKWQFCSSSCVWNPCQYSATSYCP
jgi:hypothetical protein